MPPLLIAGAAALLVLAAIGYYGWQRSQKTPRQAGTTAQPQASVSASPPQPTTATSPQVVAAAEPSPAIRQDGDKLFVTQQDHTTVSADTQYSPTPIAAVSPFQERTPDLSITPTTDVPATFVEQFVADLGNNDIETQLRYYSDRTDYYDFGRVDKAAIGRDLRGDVRTWPRRMYSIQPAPSITSTSTGFIAQFLIAYKLYGSRGVSSGMLDITLNVEGRGETAQITRIQKKVISAHRSK
jgi:hypothetical protein